MGGLIVGLVTKYAGGVVKGFALIAGKNNRMQSCRDEFLNCFAHDDSTFLPTILFVSMCR